MKRDLASSLIIHRTPMSMSMSMSMSISLPTQTTQVADAYFQNEPTGMDHSMSAIPTTPLTRRKRVLPSKPKEERRYKYQRICSHSRRVTFHVASVETSTQGSNFESGIETSSNSRTGSGNDADMEQAETCNDVQSSTRVVPEGQLTSSVHSACRPLHELQDQYLQQYQQQQQHLCKQQSGFPSLFQTLTTQDTQRLWYRDDDIRRAKEYVRYLLHQKISNDHHHHEHRHRHPQPQGDNANHSNVQNIDRMKTEIDKECQDTSCCGLSKYHPERSRQKKSAIQYVSMASETYKTKECYEEFIYALATKCSQQARQVAQYEALELYKQLYHPTV